jgi:antitoxin HigA-1
MINFACVLFGPQRVRPTLSASIIIRNYPMKPKNGMRAIHPGEILQEEFLSPLDMSATRLAQVIEVPPNRLTELVAERRAITADTALRLARALGTSAEFWMNLQKTYELRTTEIELGNSLKSIKPLPTAGVTTRGRGRRVDSTTPR